MNHPCDFNEDDATYLRLIRVGHAIWRLLRADRRLKSHTHDEEQASYDAIEIIVKLKQDRKAELRRLRVIEAARVGEYFKRRKRVLK